MLSFFLKIIFWVVLVIVTVIDTNTIFLIVFWLQVYYIRYFEGLEYHFCYNYMLKIEKDRKKKNRQILTIKNYLVVVILSFILFTLSFHYPRLNLRKFFNQFQVTRR